jgi:hypothetical protein
MLIGSRLPTLGLPRKANKRWDFGGSTFGAPISTCRRSQLLLVILGQRWTYGHWVVLWLEMVTGEPAFCGSIKIWTL